MKHAGPDTLDRLEPLLCRIRDRQSLREKKRGVFYLRSRAFLHFHDDPDGLFADVRIDGVEFDRLRVSTRAEQRELLRRIDETLSSD